jgi:hypothetical protein
MWRYRLAAAAAIALATGFATWLAPAATALPQCTNTNATTTQCERPGNAQINTSPGPYNNGYTGPFPEFPWYPWGFSGIGIGIGL